MLACSLLLMNTELLKRKSSELKTPAGLRCSQRRMGKRIDDADDELNKAPRSKLRGMFKFKLGLGMQECQSCFFRIPQRV
jgi:hypothetical protein